MQGAQYWGPRLRKVLARKAPLDTKLEAIETLGAMKESAAIPDICTLLDDTDAAIRAAAARALGEFRSPRTVALLERHRADAEPAVRDAVDWALQQRLRAPRFRPKWSRVKARHADEAFQEAQAQWGDDRDGMVRQYIEQYVTTDRMEHTCAIWVLGHSALPEAITFLEAALPQEEDALDRLYIAQELARNHRPYPIEPFETCIRMWAHYVPEEGIDGIVALKDVRGVPALISGMSNRRVEVRVHAGRALIKLTKQDFGWDQEAWQACR